MRKQTRALLLVLVACGGGPRLPPKPRGDVVLEVRGGVKGGPYQLGREDLAGLPRRTFEGTDPHDGRTASWEGADLATLLGRLELKAGADTVLVRTGDRRAIAIPLNFVRQLRPVLADRADGQPIADRLLAWPTAAQRGLLSDPRTPAWWARDVAALELVNGWTLTRAVLVPAGAAPGARLGADLFGARCLACHRMRKAGGEKGPDLTRVADRIERGAFQALLARHPGWADAGREPPGDEAAADLWAFLHAVSVETAGGAIDEPAAPELPPREDRPSGDPGPAGGY